MQVLTDMCNGVSCKIRCLEYVLIMFIFWWI